VALGNCKFESIVRCECIQAVLIPKNILIVVLPDGTYQSTPFNVRIKKAFAGEKVDVTLNGKKVENLNLVVDVQKTIRMSEIDGAEVSQLLTQEKLQTMEFNVGEDNWFEFTSHQSKRAKRVRALVWHQSVKIVVTDIDGTITRSNVRGHLMPRLGVDWAHAEVSKFFQKLYHQGYKIIYLTARSIRMNSMTREYLSSLDLPPGPIFAALKNIRKSVVSELFTGDSKFSKVAHLEDILKLFPESFVAGFGNNAKDFWTYNQVNIPDSHLFIINKKSKITVSSRNTSYSDLLRDVENWFPDVSIGCVGVGDSQAAVSEVRSPQ